VHIISLGENEAAEALYQKLNAQGISALYDDRELSAGEKFADADLLGMPVQVIVGKHFQESGNLEWKERRSGAKGEGSEVALIDYLGKQYAPRHSS
jgi:prolyl-tRNA synthetase